MPWPMCEACLLSQVGHSDAALRAGSTVGLYECGMRRRPRLTPDQRPVLAIQRRSESIPAGASHSLEICMDSSNDTFSRRHAVGLVGIGMAGMAAGSATADPGQPRAT